MKVWQARGPENKKMVSERKGFIQDRFINEMGILADILTQQEGNTNGSNIARHFLETLN